MACEKFHMRNSKKEVVHGAIGKSVECPDPLDERIRVEPGTDLVVDERDRRDTAGAEAINDFERELVIRRGFALRDADGVLKRVEIFAGAAHVARRAVANANQIPSTPCQMKLRIKRRDAVDAAQRNARLFGNEVNRFLRQVAINILRPLQDGNECAFLAFELFEDAGEAGEINQWLWHRGRPTVLGLIR